MRTSHGTWVSGVLALLLSVLSLAGSAPVRGATDALGVTGAVQVTSNPDPVRAHSSPQVARIPETGELVVVEADVRGDRRCSVHISVDDGRSWFPGGELMVEPFTDCTIGAEWGTYFNAFVDADGTLFVPFAANDPRFFDASDDASALRGARTGSSSRATSSSLAPTMAVARSRRRPSTRRRPATRLWDTPTE